MKDKMRLLIQLQECDNRIRETSKRREEAPARTKELSDGMEAADASLKEEQERLEQLRKDRRKIEQEIQDLESRIEKSSVKLSNIKSNKEYTAALKEIEDLKNMKFQVEDKAIQSMEEIERAEKRHLELKDSLPEWKNKLEREKLAVEREVADLGKVLEELERKRHVFMKGIDKDVLKRYNFLKERKGGQAVSSVVLGVCQTCNLGIPPQQFNELIRGSELLECPHCHRIIYWGEDKHFQIPPDQV